MAEESLKYKTKKGIYWTAFNQLSLTGMQFVVGIFMARLLSPEDYGIAALPAVFISIASTIMEGGFSTALIRKQEVTEEDLSTSFYYSIIVGCTSYICLFFASPLIASFYNTPILTILIRVTALSFLWGPLITPQNVILTRKLDFKTQAKISVVNKIISAIIGITVAYAGYGIWALIISNLCASFIGLCQTWWIVKWLPRKRWSKESFTYLWGFGNKLMLSNLLQTIYTNITPIVVGKYYSPKDLGLYNRAQGYAHMPIEQISGIVQKVTFPVLSKAQANDDELLSIYRKLISSICFVTFPIMFLLLVLSRPLIIVMITEKWESCIILMQMLCFYKMWAPMSWLNINILQVKGRTDLFLKLDVKKKIVGFALMCIFLPFGLRTFCLGLIINQVYVMYVNIKMTEQVINLTLLQQLKDVSKSYLLSFLMASVVIIVSLVLDNYYLQLFIGGVVGLMFYFGCAYLLRLEEIDMLKYIINYKKK